MADAVGHIEGSVLEPRPQETVLTDELAWKFAMEWMADKHNQYNVLSHLEADYSTIMSFDYIEAWVTLPNGDFQYYVIKEGSTFNPLVPEKPERVLGVIQAYDADGDIIERSIEELFLDERA